MACPKNNPPPPVAILQHHQAGKMEWGIIRRPLKCRSILFLFYFYFFNSSCQHSGLVLEPVSDKAGQPRRGTSVPSTALLPENIRIEGVSGTKADESRVNKPWLVRFGFKSTKLQPCGRVSWWCWLFRFCHSYPPEPAIGEWVEKFAPSANTLSENYRFQLAGILRSFAVAISLLKSAILVVTWVYLVDFSTSRWLDISSWKVTIPASSARVAHILKLSSGSLLDSRSLGNLKYASYI